MITVIAVPKLTLTMEGGTLVRWLKKEGDVVVKDEVLYEIETDKANAEVPSPASGRLKKIVIQEGPVTVGLTVGYIGEEQDILTEAAMPNTAAPPTQVTLSAPSPAAPTSSESNTIRATPAARRRAHESGIDLVTVIGTGPEGRITQEDVEASIAKPAPSAAPSNFRSIIAERTLQAWHTVPHIHVGGELNADGLKAAMEKAKAGKLAVSVTDLLLFATASVLRSFPVLNSVWSKNAPETQSDINLGFAVHTERGVVIPVIRGVDRRSLADISSERLRLRNAAASHSLQPGDLEGGTFTLSNLGMFPVDFFAPIVNYPQCAIMATGRIKRAGFVDPDAAGPAWAMWANLALDHRVADGAVAAEFLAKLESAIKSLKSVDL